MKPSRMNLRFAILFPLVSPLAAVGLPPQTQVSFTAGPSESWAADWAGVDERTYFVQYSLDLVNWSYLPVIRFGDGPQDTDGVAENAPKFFIRLKYADDTGVTTLQQARDADFDNDGIPNYYEVENLFSDPLDKNSAGGDSDSDGLPDGWELFHFGGLGIADHDEALQPDGLTNKEKAELGLNPPPTTRTKTPANPPATPTIPWAGSQMSPLRSELETILPTRKATCSTPNNMKSRIIAFLLLSVGALQADPGWVNSDPASPETFVANAAVPVSPFTFGEPQNESMGGPLAPLSIGNAADLITPEIQSLADGLQHDPIRIFNHVYNHIDFQAYYGSKKGAAITLMEGKGNQFDTCALLVSLLRASGYDAEYRIGAAAFSYATLRTWLGLSSYPLADKTDAQIIALFGGALPSGFNVLQGRQFLNTYNFLTPRGYPIVSYVTD